MTGILTENANLTNSYQYDPYGNLTSGTADGVNYYGYNGESTNVKTGLQYLRARYYNAENGTFTTEDSDLGTTENPLTRNRYDYTTNNPLNYSDPTGHSLWSRIKSTAKKAAKAVKSVGKKIVNTAKKVVKTVVNTIKTVTRTVKNAVKGTAQKVKNIVTHPKQTYESAKKNITRTYGNVVSRGSSFIRSASKNVKKTGKKYYSSFKSYVSDRTKEIRKNVKRELCTTTNRISTSLENLENMFYIMPSKIEMMQAKTAEDGKIIKTQELKPLKKMDAEEYKKEYLKKIRKSNSSYLLIYTGIVYVVVLLILIIVPKERFIAGMLFYWSFCVNV